MRRIRTQLLSTSQLGRSVPLGYDPKDGKLVVNKTEATTVRMIFERFANWARHPRRNGRSPR